MKRNSIHLGWIILWLIVFWPIGIYMLWKNEQIARENRE